jgi:DNA ligase-associated metallophosphoesterase
MSIELAGETLLLHPERVLIWPARRTAFLADFHLGKSDVFRRAGIPIPEGTTLADLQRLTRLVDTFELDAMVVLGDFVHGRSSMDAVHRKHFAEWRSKHRGVHVVVVAGNHDWNEQDRGNVWGVEWVNEGFKVGTFVCAHHPGKSPDGYVLSGHVHPVVKLHASSRERARIPAFCVTTDCAILPSFGSFTGGAEVDLDDHDHVYGFAGQRVWRIR